MTLNFTRCDAADKYDEAKQDRTAEFFHLIEKKKPLDAKLIQLLEEGICLEAVDNDGMTPLMMASRHGRTDVINSLIKAGANLEAVDNYGRTPLLHATWFKHTGIDSVKALIKAGANLEAVDNYGRTPLIISEWNSNDSVVDPLVKAGANIEARKNNGETPLTLALRFYRSIAAAEWLERGANVYARDNDGNRPIDYINFKIGSDDLKLLVDGWRKAYDDFAANGTAPRTKADVYHLLAVTPLLNEKAPVNTTDHIRKIMLHAKWDDMKLPLGILSELVNDGTIKPEDAADIQNSLMTKGPDRFVNTISSLGMVR